MLILTTPLYMGQRPRLTLGTAPSGLINAYGKLQNTLVEVYIIRIGIDKQQECIMKIKECGVTGSLPVRQLQIIQSHIQYLRAPICGGPSYTIYDSSNNNVNSPIIEDSLLQRAIKTKSPSMPGGAKRQQC